MLLGGIIQHAKTTRVQHKAKDAHDGHKDDDEEREERDPSECQEMVHGLLDRESIDTQSNDPALLFRCMVKEQGIFRQRLEIHANAIPDI